MTLAANTSVRTPGSGEDIAAQTVSSKKHQVIMLADLQGHIWGSKPSYGINIQSQVHVNTANTVHWDLWNGDGSKIIRVRSVLQIPNITSAVTGVVFDWKLARTTSIGTGGSSQTIFPWDTNNTIDADVTCRSKPTGGAAEGTILRNYSLSSEETNTATIQVASMGGLELLPPYLQMHLGGEGLVLRPSQGVRCVQVTQSAAGNTGWLITVTEE